MKRLLVTGTGRCGTGYIAEVLRASGVPCGHEQIFTDEVILDDKPSDWVMPWIAESSWMAVPRLPLVGVPVVLLVRHPLATIKSLVDLGFFAADTAYTRVAYSVFPEIRREPTPVDRAAMFWTLWNLRAFFYADYVCRVETFGGAELDRILQLADCSNVVDTEAVIGSVPKDTNAKSGQKYADTRVEWEMIRPGIAQPAQALAALWGYTAEVARP